jgi:hypothetical protein
VWDNRTNRSAFNVTLKLPVKADIFAHGFIEEGLKPCFLFMERAGTTNTFQQPKKDLIEQAVGIWVTAARVQSAGKTTPDGKSLVTGIGLQAGDAQDFEIRIGFFEGFRAAHNTVGSWMTYPLQAYGVLLFGPSVRILVSLCSA